MIKKKNPGLKTLISVGGWTWSRDFSDVALTDASRKKFARSCNDFITKYGFDGVDIDWEYPITGGLPGNIYRPEDGANYVLLLQAIRDAIGADKQLSIAAPASPIVVRGMKLLEMSKIWDFVNLMSMCACVEVGYGGHSSLTFSSLSKLTTFAVDGRFSPVTSRRSL